MNFKLLEKLLLSALLVVAMTSLFLLNNLIIKNYSVRAATSYGDPDPKSLNKKENVDTKALLNINNDYRDGRYTINKTPLNTTKSLLNFDLLFKSFGWLDTKFEDIKDLRVEFSSKEIASEFKNKNVNVNGIYYQANCQGEHKVPTACMYGGVTNIEGNNVNPAQNIAVSVYQNGVNQKSFLISTDKKQVTAQELDEKARTRVNNDFRLYDREGQIQRGYIKFHSHSDSSKSFYYDLYNIKGHLPDQYLQFYNDNKIINSSDYHIDVYLFTQ
ncbi:exotoxin beta-grasp domain-containing protein [Staphylococcus agnetis]|uniref:Exotoxin n=1 Tax=Staphylococcus agnetis TaxID=985762 RepID=A0A2T4MCR6_9STAP|nr:exotoxin beta-grasp domain-containing protein [Staphylococcus agnetis]NJI01813.1 exotoxin [Staphylococcus agnetis]PTH26409.1 exotoxin [Staphylococcus agnetis]PTH38013.1 exotoxin [Staphylococcus agnetis]